jgi:hypothetical protein
VCCPLDGNAVNFHNLIANLQTPIQIRRATRNYVTDQEGKIQLNKQADKILLIIQKLTKAL